MIRALAFIGLLATAPSSFACDEGFAAFQNTVYMKVRRDCALCHDGTKKAAPPFATTDALSSYNQLLNYMNFTNVDESLLVIRAGNGHCGIANCQGASGPEMAQLATQWYQMGENVCKRNGVYFSAEIPLPANLPTADQGFVPLTFDLGAIKPELAGMSMVLEAQLYLDKSGALTRGAYRFRSPRLIGGTKSVYIKDLKVLLNGKYDAVYDNYTVVDRTVPFFAVSDPAKTSTPVLSEATMLILRDSLPDQKVSVSFVEIDARTDEAQCPNPDGFKAKVQPLLTAQNCASCHKSGGASLGEKVFDVTAASSKLCSVSAALVDPNYFMTSPLIQVPAQGIMGHPQMSDDQRYDYVAALRAWLNR